MVHGASPQFVNNTSHHENSQLIFHSGSRPAADAFLALAQPLALAAAREGRSPWPNRAYGNFFRWSGIDSTLTLR
jgi:hypothetical protein